MVEGGRKLSGEEGTQRKVWNVRRLRLTRDATDSADAVNHSCKCVTIIERDLNSEVGNTQLGVDCSNGSPGL